MFKEISELKRKGSYLERTLFYSLAAVLFFYIVHFGFLAFLNSPWDFDHLAGYYEIAWRFWVTQSFPAGFNPYLEGGRTLGGDPQIFLYSPWVFIAGLNPLLAVKWQMLAEALLGAWGLWKWLHSFRLLRVQKLWGLLLYLCGGAVVCRMATGHVTLGYLFFYPTLLYLSQCFERKGFWKTRAFALYLLLFAYLGNHKPNFFIYGLPPLFVEALVRGVVKRNFRAFLALGFASGGSALVNAASLLPSFSYFREFPRHDGDEWVGVPLYTYFANLLLPLRTLPGFVYGPRFLQRHEYNLFLGPLTLYFAWRGCKTLYHWQKSTFLSLFITSLLFLWVGMGSNDPKSLNPYNLFYSFWPGFHSVRVPPRFWVFPTFFLVLLSVMGLTNLERPRIKSIFIWLGIFPLVLSALVNLSKPTFETTPTKFLPPRVYLTTFEWKKNDIEDQLRPLREGKGVLFTINNLSLPKFIGVEEKNLLPPGFQWQDWSHIAFDIQSDASKAIALNLNYHPYWSLKGDGKILESDKDGPLTIEVPHGNSKGTLEFKQPMSYEGLVFTVLSIAILLLYVAWVLSQSKKGDKKQNRIIGLTGGIGSGKSTVAGLFREEGIPVIDMDQIGREILETDKKVQAEIIKLCGEEVRTNSGLDRKKIREVVFADPQKRKALEAILHPRIWKTFQKEANKFFNEGKSVVLCEAALLIENKGMERLDGLIVVMADESTRKQRLLERDKITTELADKMLGTQASDEERKKHATFVIENQAGFYDLKEKVKSLVQHL